MPKKSSLLLKWVLTFLPQNSNSFRIKLAYFFSKVMLKVYVSQLYAYNKNQRVEKSPPHQILYMVLVWLHPRVLMLVLNTFTFTMTLPGIFAMVLELPFFMV